MAEKIYEEDYEEDDEENFEEGAFFGLEEEELVGRIEGDGISFRAVYKGKATLVGATMALQWLQDNGPQMVLARKCLFIKKKYTKKNALRRHAYTNNTHIHTYTNKNDK